MDAPAVGRPDGGTRSRGFDLARNGARVSQKNVLKPHKHEQCVIPPEQNGAFVAAMEDVLDVYQKPYEPQCPVVCFDERPCHLIADVKERVPGSPGRLARYDDLYTRLGSLNLFGMLEPNTGRVHFEVTERHTKMDVARSMKQLVDELYPRAVTIRVVLDNLATHTKGALYEAFSPEEAHRLARKLEFHFTPKHGSWLNAIELEFAALTKQALDHRIPDRKELERVVGVYESLRNEHACAIQWTFNAESARTKLSRLYPLT
nr:IS630 family transposase [uncultured Deinococcus sp.]